MKKIKIFLDPIGTLEPWLNKIAHKGYRLISINNCVYHFEKTHEQYSYCTQFIGANPSKENEEYVNMLTENDTKVFRAPLNQGNIAFGKFRLRPYAKGDAKFANTFKEYNKEILVVENVGNKPHKLLTNKADLAVEYRNIRNVYLQGVIGLLLILAFYNVFAGSFDIVKSLIGIILILLLIILSSAVYKAHKNYRKYSEESSLVE